MEAVNLLTLHEKQIIRKVYFYPISIISVHLSKLNLSKLLKQNQQGKNCCYILES
jgi:hypothetical protein